MYEVLPLVKWEYITEKYTLWVQSIRSLAHGSNVDFKVKSFGVTAGLDL